MKSNVWIILGIVILVLAVGAYVYSSTQIGKAITQTQTQPSSQTQQPAGLTGSSPNPSVVLDVKIKDYVFDPAIITINKGDSILWTNKDNANHQLISDSGNEIQSITIATEGTYTRKFALAGNYSYHCSIHPSMKGTVIVK